MNFVAEKPLDPISLELFITGHAEFTLWDGAPIAIKAGRKNDLLCIESDPLTRNLELIIHDSAEPDEVLQAGKQIYGVQEREDYATSSPVWHYRLNERILSIKLTCENESINLAIQKAFWV